MRHLALAAIFAAFTGLGPAALAQTNQPVTASISALALAPMPDATTVEIVTYDDSDLAQSVANVAGQALEGLGYQLGAGGQLRLGIELIDRIAIAERSPTLGSAQIQTGPRDESDVRVNIFADSEDSVLGGRIGPGTSDSLQFGLYVTLNDSSTGRRVWQAEIIADIGSSSREIAGPLMAQAVADFIGEPASQVEIILE